MQENLALKRYELIRLILKKERTVKQVHQASDVPLSILYWLLKRFRQEGMEGLANKSHANHDHPNWLTEDQKNQVVLYRLQHPHLTTHQIAQELAEKGLLQVHNRTVANILRERGLNQDGWTPELLSPEFF